MSITEQVGRLECNQEGESIEYAMPMEASEDDDDVLDKLSLDSRFNVKKVRPWNKAYSLRAWKLDVLVVEKLNHASMVDTFCRPPRGGTEEEQLGFLLSRMDGLILTNIPDRWVWSLEATSEFSVQYVRQLIDDSILPKEEVAT
ncbi:hypothetical protein Tco_0796557, partial [Tanacetum coccineum]